MHNKLNRNKINKQQRCKHVHRSITCHFFVDGRKLGSRNYRFTSCRYRDVRPYAAIITLDRRITFGEFLETSVGSISQSAIYLISNLVRELIQIESLINMKHKTLTYVINKINNKIFTIMFTPPSF